MPLLGQASGGWTEGSSALRILHVGIRNTVGVLAADAFTQVNPVGISTAGALSTSAGMNSATLGVLGGSVAFTRPDGGSNQIGGPPNTGQSASIDAGPGLTGVDDCIPLGVFINTAVGLAYENTPGVASGKGPYVSGQGTYANDLYETQSILNATIGNALAYTTGQLLYASANGLLTNELTGRYEARITGTPTTIMGVLKMPNDAVQAELVYDQRI